MLRVGLTGGLGSGKTAAALLFAALGAEVLQSDTIGRELMVPGQHVYADIIARFGPDVALADGRLDRAALARIAFVEGRVEELNAIVHPAVIARQAEQTEEIFKRNPQAVVIVESALIFETKYSEINYSETKHSELNRNAGSQSNTGWRNRFDKIILVTAPEELKIARFVARSTSGVDPSPEQRELLAAEARRRLAQQLSDERKSAMSDYVLTNAGAFKELEWQVDHLWPILKDLSEHGTDRPVQNRTPAD